LFLVSNLTNQLHFSVDGKTLLDKVASMHSLTEDDVAGFIRQLLEFLEDWHSNNIVHLDLRVSGLRLSF